MIDVLKKVNKIGGVRGTILVGKDGLVIASDVSDNEDSGTIGAVGANIITRISGALERLKLGKLKRFVMNGPEGNAVLFPVGKAILLTLVRKDANMGLVLVELKDCAVQLDELLG